MNRLTHQTLDADGATGSIPVQQTAYVYDGNQVVLQFEKTGSGDLATTDLKHRMLWGPAVDQLLAQENLSSLTTPGDTLWALTDHLNSVRDLATYSGGVTSLIDHRVFDAFGNKTYQSNSTIDCHLYYTAGELQSHFFKP